MDTLERMVKEDIPEKINLGQDQAGELTSATVGAGESLVCWKKKKSECVLSKVNREEVIEMRRKVGRNQITKGLISHGKSLNVILSAMGRFWNRGVIVMDFCV